MTITKDRRASRHDRIARTIYNREQAILNEVTNLTLGVQSVDRIARLGAERIDLLERERSLSGELLWRLISGNPKFNENVAAFYQREHRGEYWRRVLILRHGSPWDRACREAYRTTDDDGRDEGYRNKVNAMLEAIDPELAGYFHARYEGPGRAFANPPLYLGRPWEDVGHIGFAQSGGLDI